MTWGLDDFPAFEFVLGMIPGYRTPSDVREIWQGDFDYALKNCPKGIFNLTLHPQVIGRGHRITMLEALLRYMADHRGATFRTMADYASEWKASHPKAAWMAAHPEATGVNSIMRLP